MLFDPNAIMRSYITDTDSLEDMLYVKGKVAIVTGGTSGLGFCVAQRLLQGGAKGVGFGTASHVIGTSRATEISPLIGAVSSLSLTLAGLITTVIMSILFA